MAGAGTTRLPVTIDRDACVGTGDCARLAPDAFRVRDDLLIAEVLAGAAQTDPGLLREAAGACPMQAISFTDHEGAGT